MKTLLYATGVTLLILQPFKINSWVAGEQRVSEQPLPSYTITLVPNEKLLEKVATNTITTVSTREPLPKIDTNIREHNFDVTPEEYIYLMAEKYGVDVKLALKIMECESVAYANASGEAIKDVVNYNRDETGAVWSSDIGRWQLNDYYHQVPAYNMGFSLNNDYDNIEYGFYLMSQEGTQPWQASKYCWGA